MRFADRKTAGERLARELGSLRDERPIVLALPRGGVVTGAAVAEALGVPLDIVVTRKLGAPLQPELAMGAVAEGGALYVNREVFDDLDLDADEIEQAAMSAMRLIDRRAAYYREERQPIDIEHRTVVLVDDGVATGSTVLAALRAIRAQHPRQIMLAVPVGAPSSMEQLAHDVDRIICLEQPADFVAVGLHYHSFPQVSDEEVVQLLRDARARTVGSGTVSIELDDVVLEGNLIIPDGASGIVLFAHGSGSSHRSPRNRYVASQLQAAGLGTLLFDLLSTDEEATDHFQANYRFDIGLLARRLLGATDWLERSGFSRGRRIGYFGSSTGAAAALVAASVRPETTGAVVSRGGRPDMAEMALERVRAPTLLIVGGADDLVIELNQNAIEQMTAETQLVLVPGATHLFEEPGALEQVAQLAASWFRNYLALRPEAEAHP